MKSVSIVVVVGALVLSACATTLQTHSDHDPSQSFAGYHTFAWLTDQPMIAAPEDVASVSPLNRRRIEQAVEEELADKGFQKSPARDSADFVVSYTVGARDRLDVQSYPVPYRGPWLWGWSYYGHDVDVMMYREGTLAIDVFDNKTHQPVWHGWGSRRIDEHDVKHAAELIPPAVAAILKNFPPG
jgi:Domain of unknown function (DUF4136)